MNKPPLVEIKNPMKPWQPEIPDLYQRYKKTLFFLFTVIKNTNNGLRIKQRTRNEIIDYFVKEEKMNRELLTKVEEK